MKIGEITLGKEIRISDVECEPDELSDIVRELAGLANVIERLERDAYRGPA